MRGCARSRFVSPVERWSVGALVRRGEVGRPERRSEPRGGHQGSASGPWRTSGELHPLSRPLNPRAVRLVRVRLSRSTVRPSVRSHVHSFVRSHRVPFAFIRLPSRLRPARSSEIRNFSTVFFSPRDYPPETVVVQRWCSIRGGKRRGQPRLLRVARRDCGIYSLGFFGGSSPPHADRPSSHAVDANLSCMVSTLQIIPDAALTGDRPAKRPPSPGWRFAG